ncbi:hypothetical protein TNCV_5077621 [Trichonephila clavipes]|uniref:Uncharacterized protein n=1 Tax=Trichonephila clavipes TaxID=2585209 RepID=A0A8X6VCP1_TRICX|nr:hypothetical protein TNCV_5077621 [Trichonephila clavipes]
MRPNWSMPTRLYYKTSLPTRSLKALLTRGFEVLVPLKTRGVEALVHVKSIEVQSSNVGIEKEKECDLEKRYEFLNEELRALLVLEADKHIPTGEGKYEIIILFSSPKQAIRSVFRDLLVEK